jgi:FAD/FMN-containing dehydrogenase
VLRTLRERRGSYPRRAPDSNDAPEGGRHDRIDRHHGTVRGTGRRVRASYHGNYDRLAQIKRRYDPDNTFHVNQNIQPARQPGA